VNYVFTFDSSALGVTLTPIVHFVILWALTAVRCAALLGIEFVSWSAHCFIASSVSWSVSCREEQGCHLFLFEQSIPHDLQQSLWTALFKICSTLDQNSQSCFSFMVPRNLGKFLLSNSKCCDSTVQFHVFLCVFGVLNPWHFTTSRLGVLDRDEQPENLPASAGESANGYRTLCVYICRLGTPSYMLLERSSQRSYSS